MQLDLKVTGMTCLDCSRHVTRALERVEGVQSATVDYRAGSAVVEVTEPPPVDALLAAVERAGYHAEPAGPIVAAPAAARPSVPVATPTRPVPAPLGSTDFDLQIGRAHV